MDTPLDKLTLKEQHTQIQTMLTSTGRQLVRWLIEKACGVFEAKMYRELEWQKYDLKYAEIDLHRAKYDMLKKILEHPEQTLRSMTQRIEMNPDDYKDDL